jgi:hypothetical protein
MVLRADVRDSGETTPSGGARLARRKQPSTALVPLRTVRFPPLPNRVPIDHTNADSAAQRRGIALHRVTRSQYSQAISIHLSLRLS